MGRKLYLKEAAEESGLKLYTLRRMSKEGKIPYITSGNRAIYDMELLDIALKELARENIKPAQEQKLYGVLRKINA